MIEHQRLSRSERYKDYENYESFPIKGAQIAALLLIHAVATLETSSLVIFATETYGSPNFSDLLFAID